MKALELLFEFNNPNLPKFPKKGAEEKSERGDHDTDRDKREERGKELAKWGGRRNQGRRPLAGCDHAGEVKGIDVIESLNEVHPDGSQEQHRRGQAETIDRAIGERMIVVPSNRMFFSIQVFFLPRKKGEVEWFDFALVVLRLSRRVT